MARSHHGQSVFSLLLEIESLVSLSLIRLENQFQKLQNQFPKFLNSLFLQNHSWYQNQSKTNVTTQLCGSFFTNTNLEKYDFYRFPCSYDMPYQLLLLFSITFLFFIKKLRKQVLDFTFLSKCFLFFSFLQIRMPVCTSNIFLLDSSSSLSVPDTLLDVKNSAGISHTHDLISFFPP